MYQLRNTNSTFTRISRWGIDHFNVWWVTYLLICCSALLALHPVLKDFSHSVVSQVTGGISSDTNNYLYTIQRFAINLSNARNPFFDPLQNYPDGLDLAYLDIPWVMYVLVSPVSIAVSPEAAFNSIVLLAHISTAIALAHWAFLLGVRNQWALRIASIVSIWLPFRITHSIDHPNIVSTQFLIIWFIAIEWWIQSTQRTSRHYYGIALAMALLVTNSFQYAFIAVIIGTPYILLRITNTPKRAIIWREYGYGLTALGVGAYIGLFPLLNAQHVQFKAFSAAATVKFSATLMHYITPTTYSLWAKISTIQALAHQNTNEQTIFIGIVVGVLALYGAWRASGYDRRSLGSSILVGVLFSFGLAITLSSTLIHTMTIPLPAQLFPFLGITAFRAWARFGGATELIVCLFVAIGCEQLLRRVTTRIARYLLVGFLSIGIGGDIFPFYITATPYTENPLTSAIAALPATATIMLIPNVSSISTADTLYVIRYQLLRRFIYRQMVSYGHSAHWPLAYSGFEHDMRRIEEPETSFVLCRNGVTHLIMSNRFWQRTPAFAQNQYMKSLQVIDEWRIVALVDCQ